MRLRTVAALVGILTGVLALAGSYYGGIGRGSPTCIGPCGPNIFVIALALLLILNSLVGLVGPSLVFYASAALSVFLGASMTPNSSLTDPWVLAAVGLVVLTFALSVFAARKKTGISEQSNPMNLPVFG